MSYFRIRADVIQSMLQLELLYRFYIKIYYTDDRTDYYSDSDPYHFS